MSWNNQTAADGRQHIDEKQFVGALLSSAPAHPNALASAPGAPGVTGVPAIRTLTPKSSSKSLKDALGRKKAESTLIIPTISVTPAEGEEDDGAGRRDSFLAAQEEIAAARGVLGANAAALEARPHGAGAGEPPAGKNKRGRRGRRTKPAPLVSFDEEKHGTHPARRPLTV